MSIREPDCVVMEDVFVPFSGSSVAMGGVRPVPNVHLPRLLVGSHLVEVVRRVPGGSVSSGDFSMQRCRCVSGYSEVVRRVPSSIYVRNLPEHATKLDLYQRFAVFGGVSSVNVLKGRRVGFVNFTRPEAALAAVQTCASNDVKLQQPKFVLVMDDG